MSTTEVGTALPDAVFRREGEGDAEVLIPTALARGPWHSDTQHGGPMLGLLARALERYPSERPVQITRMSADLMRAAPLGPVSTRVQARRVGKAVEFLDASLYADGEEVARATAMRFRIASPVELAVLDEDAPDSIAVERGRDPMEPPPLPDEAAAMPMSHFARKAPIAFHHAQQIRPAPGLETPTIWVRLHVPLVEGESATPLVRVAIAADFTYSVPVVRNMWSADGLKALRAPRVIPINPDTSLNLHRQLEGEWVCLDSQVEYDRSGAGTALARLFDERGYLGHASQTILLRGAQARPRGWDEFAGRPEGSKGRRSIE